MSDWIRESLIVDLRDNRTAAKATYKSGTFNIIRRPPTADVGRRQRQVGNLPHAKRLLRGE